MKPLYLDDTASMRVWPDVTRAMNEIHANSYGNPSSIHAMGERALERFRNAKQALAHELHAKEHEVYLTSGGTEANNWALQGLADAHPNKKTIIVSSIEHPSVHEVCTHLQTQGYRVITLPVTREGIVNLDALREALARYKDILCVSVMHVNNVIGTIQPIGAIGELCNQHKVLFHTDACQSFGKLALDVQKLRIGVLSACAHKLGGPKGIGLLYVKERVKISPLLYGGGQERMKRSGTENVAGAVGFATALTTYKKKVNRTRLATLRDYCMRDLERMGGTIHGDREQRLFNHIHVSFPNIESDTLVMYLSEKGFYVSSGSACDAKKEATDAVLHAIGVHEKGRGFMRVTLSYAMKEAEVDRFIRALHTVLQVLRK